MNGARRPHPAGLFKRENPITASGKSSMTSAPNSKSPMRRVLGLRDFRLLFGGTATSILGDQFYLIATPWLVLQITNNPLVLGLVLAFGGVPRAIFMLIGGALTDRFSPRALLISSDFLRLV